MHHLCNQWSNISLDALTPSNPGARLFDALPKLDTEELKVIKAVESVIIVNIQRIIVLNLILWENRALDIWMLEYVVM